jgi:hypothetical protein
MLGYVVIIPEHGGFRMNKTRLALVLGTAGVLALHLTSASAQPLAPKVSESKSYANDISNVPCSAFRNNGDGSWTELAAPAASNRLLFQGSVYSGAMARHLQKRCGAKRG